MLRFDKQCKPDDAPLMQPRSAMIKIMALAKSDSDIVEAVMPRVRQPLLADEAALA